MKREDKNLQSRQKIMDAALKEFGGRSYGEASLNTICKEGEISKGIIYHYFKDKDALFLACVQECFDALTMYLKEHIRTADEDCTEGILKQYFDTRMAFFLEHPEYRKLFYGAVITPPPHLAGEIRGMRKTFEELNVSILTGILSKVPLREGMSIEEVIHIFEMFQELVNTRCYAETDGGTDFGEYEKMCGQVLEILLYGVIERR